MKIEEMKSIKQERGLTNSMIAEASGVPLSTVQKIFCGAVKAPRKHTIDAITRVLENDIGSAAYKYPGDDFGAPVFREESSAYSTFPQGSGYTIKDYYALPDEPRVELIDGRFYDMAAPHTLHQAIVGYLYKKLLDFVLENKGPCFPLVSPTDVQLDEDDRTMVQPDVLVLCDRNKLKDGHVFGAPDLVIEVLSPSTRKKDMQLKLYKYANAGVREYWMVDPVKKTVVQYDLEHLDLPFVCGFDAVIPVLIWEGRYSIDLREMCDVISFLME